MGRKKENIQELLTEKQEQYCQQYVICGNQSAAYRIAFDADSMNSNTVAVEACRLHSNPNIALRIKEIQNEAYERNKIAIDEIVHTLAGFVRFDIAELYDENGALLPVHEMPMNARRMISSLDVEEMRIQGSVIGHVRKVRTINKLEAVEKLMKHLGGYEKDNEQKGKPVVNINLGDGEPINED